MKADARSSELSCDLQSVIWKKYFSSHVLPQIEAAGGDYLQRSKRRSQLKLGTQLFESIGQLFSLKLKGWSDEVMKNHEVLNMMYDLDRK